ncbi:UNVERIFIED_CONTAM: hypothetical protein RMT77_002963 [Armadillidium vulgare]
MGLFCFSLRLNVKKNSSSLKKALHIVMEIFGTANQITYLMILLIVWTQCLESIFRIIQKPSFKFIELHEANHRVKRSSPFDNFRHLHQFHTIDFLLPNSGLATTQKKGKKEKAKKPKEPQTNEIPPGTTAQFTPPKISDPKARHEKYQRISPIDNLNAAYFIIDDPPFFETIDQGQLVIGLNNFRKANGISFIKLLSHRPFFPFFVKT